MSVNPKYKSLLALFMGKVPLRDSTLPLKIQQSSEKICCKTIIKQDCTDRWGVNCPTHE